jgi:hypothetical protein
VFLVKTNKTQTPPLAMGLRPAEVRKFLEGDYLNRVMAQFNQRRAAPMTLRVSDFESDPMFAPVAASRMQLQNDVQGMVQGWEYKRV